MYAHEDSTRRVRGGRRLASGVLAALMLLASGGAQASTAIGTILTNIVSATMWDGPLSGNNYEVSYNSTAYVTVIPPARFEFLKSVNLTMASSGATVVFSICVNNGANTSVCNLTLTDRIPNYMAFVGTPTNWAYPNYNLSNPPPATVTVSNGANPVPGMTAGAPAAGQAGPWYLRWTFSYVGPGKSACVTYAASIL